MTWIRRSEDEKTYAEARRREQKADFSEHGKQVRRLEQANAIPEIETSPAVQLFRDVREAGGLETGLHEDCVT